MFQNDRNYKNILFLIEKRKKEISNGIRIKFWDDFNHHGDVANDRLINMYYSMLEESLRLVAQRSEPEEFVFNNIIFSLPRWARISHVPYETLRNRVYKIKMNFVEALFKEVK